MKTGPPARNDFVRTTMLASVASDGELGQPRLEMHIIDEFGIGLVTATAIAAAIVRSKIPASPPRVLERPIDQISS